MNSWNVICIRMLDYRILCLMMCLQHKLMKALMKAPLRPNNLLMASLDLHMLMITNSLFPFITERCINNGV